LTEQTKTILKAQMDAEIADELDRYEQALLEQLRRMYPQE
jgi:hypothetical protein